MANGDDDDDDDDIDLFGSDEDDEEAERIKQERVDAYAAKKSKKPALIAKSSILLDVKPVCIHISKCLISCYSAVVNTFYDVLAIYFSKS